MIQFYKRALLTVGILAFPLLLQAQQFKVVGYLTNWGSFVSDANKIDYNKVTHINIAFVNPTDDDGTIGPVDNLTTVVNIIHNNNVKVLASIGGAAPPANLTTLVQPANRTAFVKKIVDFVDTYDLDGMDIDFEGSAVDANYGAFIKQLSDSIKKRDKLLTSALGTWYGNKVTNQTLTYFDWVNIMSYDAYGTWTGPGEHSTMTFAENDIAYWKNKGLTKEQIVLGVPFYGYRWEPSGSKTSMSYCSIISNWPRAVEKDTIKTLTGGFISYNGVPTMKEKTVLAYEEGSGIMFWTMQNDCATTNPNSLLVAINQTISNLTGNVAPTVTLTSPSDGNTFIEGEEITLSADAADSDGSISVVAFYNGAIKIGEAKTAPYTIKWIAEAGNFKIYARALDNVPATAYSDTVTISVTSAETQQPFTGTPASIPGKIEAENFDIGNNLGYYDTDATNNGGQYRSTSVDIEMCSDIGGGYNVGYVSPGEWLKYTTEVEKDSLYDIEIRYASNNPVGGQLSIEMDGENITGGTVSVSTTSGWQTWQSKKISKVRLYKGSRIVKVNVIGGEFNLNYITFTYNDPYTSIFNGNKYNNNLSIYPNPVENQSTLKLTLADQGMASITILDLTGKELMSLPNQYLVSGENQITIDGSNLKTGLYLCKVVHNGQVSTIAFSKN